MSTIKDRNGSRPSRRWRDQEDRKEYMEELYKKYLHEPGYYMGVVSHPEPEFLEIKATPLGSTAVNKANDAMEF